MPMHIEYLKEELENLDYGVETASSGEKCLKAISERIPDLVLLDYGMAGMDGLEVIRILRSNAETENLPVILLTARKDIEDRLEGLSAGADDYITKPFHIGEVVARIRALLRLQDLQKKMVDRERRLAQIQGVGQTLVTLSHHINNATQAISGMAQLASEATDEENLKQQLVDVCLRQTQRIRLVMDGLRDMVEEMNLKTVDYAGTPDAMIEITDLERKLEALDNDKGGDDLKSPPP